MTDCASPRVVVVTSFERLQKQAYAALVEDVNLIAPRLNAVGITAIGMRIGLSPTDQRRKA